SPSPVPRTLTPRTHLSPHDARPITSARSSGFGSDATFCHPVVSSGGDAGAVTPDASVNCPPERIAPYDTSSSPIDARSICVSEAVRDSGLPSVGKRTIDVPSCCAMNRPASDHEPVPPVVLYVPPVITMPSIASPDSCSPRIDCPMMRIPSSSPTVALPKSTVAITSCETSTGFQPALVYCHCPVIFQASEPESGIAGKDFSLVDACAGPVQR